MVLKFDASALRVELDETLKDLAKGKSLVCMPIINRELNTFWESVKPHLCVSTKVCGKTWSEQQLGYRCRTCETDPTCVLCLQCFQPDKHVGHDYSFTRTYGGMCDCGDPGSWDPKGFCDAHPGSTVQLELLKDIPADMLHWLNELAGFHLTALREGVHALDSTVEYNKLRSTVKSLAKNMTMLVHTGDAGRHIVARACCEGKDALLQHLFDHECSADKKRPWEGTASLLYELLPLLLPDEYFKHQFATALVKNYLNLCVRCPGSYSTKRSLRDFTVQVFTISSVCRELLKPEVFGNTRVHLLHVLLANGLRCFPLVNQNACKTSFYRRDMVVSFVLTDLSLILSCSTEAVEIILKDELLFSLFCLLLSAAQRISYIHEYTEEENFPMEIFRNIDKAVQIIFGRMRRFIYLMNQQGSNLKESNAPPACEAAHVPTSEGIVEELFRHTKKYNIDFALEFGKWQKNLSLYLASHDYRQIPNFRANIHYILDFHSKASNWMVEELIGSPSTCYTFILPFHRMVAVLASPIAQQYAAADVAEMLPPQMSAEEMDSLCVKPLRLQRLRVTPPPRRIEGEPNIEMELRTIYYEGSSLLDEDVRFLQIACCFLGPSKFARLLFREINHDNAGGSKAALLSLHLLLLIAVNGEHSPRDALEQTVMNVLALGPTTEKKFYVKHVDTYVGRNEGEDTEDREIDAVFAKVSHRTNTTNPAKYIVKDSCLEEMTIYHTGILFAEISPVVDAVSQRTSTVSLLPKLPTSGPFLTSILLLHVYETHRYVHRQLLKISTGSLKGLSDRFLLLRFLLDFIICALRTIEQRDRVCAAKGISISAIDTSQQSQEDSAATVVDIVRSITTKTEVLITPWKPKTGHKQGSSVVEVILELRGRQIYLDLHGKMDMLIAMVHELTGEMPVPASGGFHDTTTPPPPPAEASDEKYRKRQAKALAKLKAKQKAFELDEALDIDEKPDGNTGDARDSLSLGKSMRDFYAEAVCVSCHERSHESDGLGLIVHALHSNVLRVVNRDNYPVDKEAWGRRFPQELHSVQCPMDDTLHIITCGHVIHEDCLQKLILHNHSPQAEMDGHRGIELLLPHEFLCPTCTRLSSGIINLHHPATASPAFIPAQSLSPAAPQQAQCGSLEDGVTPIEMPGIEVSRSQSTLMWIHCNKMAITDFAEANPEELHGNHLETALRVFASQIALLEIQARYEPTLVHLRKLILLQALLRNILIALRTYRDGSDEAKTNVKIQRSCIELLHGKSVDGLAIGDFDVFTLLVHFIVRFVLSRDAWETTYAYLISVIRRLMQQHVQTDDARRVFTRQFTIFHMILSPDAFPLRGSLEETISQALIGDPMALCGDTSDELVHMALPGGANAHAAPRMTDPIALPFLSTTQDSFWELLRELYPLKCTRCMTAARQRLVCLCCGKLVCLSPCCPNEVTDHAKECGGGVGVFVNIHPNPSEVFLINAHTKQCALLRSPWLNEHGEEDIGCSRGKPLWKNTQNARMLTRYWLEGSYFQDPGGLVKRSWLSLGYHL
ncbi:E3 ubiquitin-protein ligase UBR1 [Perkinsela sp. CCAP 1560/4]|nr:E3 ubiquitin-protein ligase UBR1 [Perkinsela sp. CCAP 1560/4]|eukprot:KNH05506.1 E3 ubiquitin-protein ligase UBR1 [Perkinsela sp. CCAP 1560/4]